MKALANVNPRDFKDAVERLRQPNAMAVGGGSDLVGMVKEHLVAPDVLVHLSVAYTNHGALMGGFITLDELSRLPLIRGRYPVLAEAAESVGTPQIRNAGTFAGKVC